MSKPINGSRPQFRFIDLFAGIGGLRRGFDMAGGKCVFTSEIDASAQRTSLIALPNSNPRGGDCG